MLAQALGADMSLHISLPVWSCRPSFRALGYAFVDGLSVPDSRTRPPSYNVAPSQELYVIRHNHKTGERTLDLLRWGLIPYGRKDPTGGRKPINAEPKALRAYRPFARPTPSAAASFPLKASLSGMRSKE